jgi:hypothetical protein
MKTLTFAVDVLILEKCGKEIEEKQDHWFHVIKEYRLQINLDKTMTLRISGNFESYRTHKIRCVGKIQRFLMLKQVVHTIIVH